MCLSSFVHYRFASTIPFYGIILNLQHFGSNIFLFQIVFGALTALVRCLPLLVLNYMGRRTTQTLFMVLTGLLILANTFVPQGERRLDFGGKQCLWGLHWSHLSEARSKERCQLRAKYSPKPI